MDAAGRVQKAGESLQHRGPDHSRVSTFALTSGRLFLGHTRLSIIELSELGRQPMFSETSRYVVTFNGEIYNYRELRHDLKAKGHNFKSDSDSEVLLAAWAEWGSGCLSRLEGMFAFVMLDQEEQSLTLVRDPFGIKPLFYSDIDRQFAFASEVSGLKHLLTNSPTVDWQRAYDYLVFSRYDHSRHSFLEGVSQVRPGHYLQIDLSCGVVRQETCWWKPSIAAQQAKSFDDAAAQLREIFLESVRLNLRSDVPLGAALSGGIDSSSIVCAMRFLEPEIDIHTFSYVAEDEEINEEPWIDLVNKHVNAISHKFTIERGDFARDFDRIVSVQGEPFGGGSIYAQYRTYQLARERGITVTLDGQGADEMLAGYHGYPDYFIRSLIELGQYSEAAQFLREWSKWPGRGTVEMVKVLGSALVSGPLRQFARNHLVSSSNPSWIDARWLAEHGVEVGFFKEPELLEEGQGRRLVEKLRIAMSGFHISPLLRHGDRSSMAWSVESRVPFLTPALADFVLGLPESFLISRDGQTKHIFRRAMRGIVPEPILARRDKIGFEAPQRRWLPHLTEDPRWLQDVLPDLGIFKLSEAYSVIQRRSKSNSLANVQWRIVNFCRWHSLVLRGEAP